jgi:PIN domain
MTNRTNYVFVDFENVHEVDLDLIADKPLVVILVLGERHKNLPLELVKKIHQYATQVRLVEAGKSGRNALDFVLAYRLGVESIADPNGFFHIVSRDTGFDALILHLKTNGILARRDDSLAQAFDQSKPIPQSLDGRLTVVIERLAKNKTNRPKRKKTLLSQTNAYFGKQLSGEELEQIITALIARKVIEIGSKDEVVYKA